MRWAQLCSPLSLSLTSSVLYGRLTPDPCPSHPSRPSPSPRAPPPSLAVSQDLAAVDLLEVVGSGGQVRGRVVEDRWVAVGAGGGFTCHGQVRYDKQYTATAL